jgi:hypothetical protein
MPAATSCLVHYTGETVLIIADRPDAFRKTDDLSLL